MKVEFFRHNIEDADVANVTAALRGAFLTTGDWVDRFETELAAFAHRRHAVAASSGTAALHLALAAAGIGPGDEVITTALSFVATANAVVMTGARPVFVDVEPATGNIDPSLVETAVTPRTRAILPVHLYGVMCDMNALDSIARSRGLLIVEDAAHALEARRETIAPGDRSAAAMFSFYATKSITAGEGGAVVTDDSSLAELLRMMRLHGLSKNASERHKSAFSHYDMPVFGYKCNMSNIQAAMLIGQIPRIEPMLRERQSIYERYRGALSGIPGLFMPEIPPGCLSGLHLFTVWVDPSRRDSTIAFLQSKGVGVTVNYRPIHLMSWYRRTFSLSDRLFPNAERIGASTISLPFYPRLTPAEIDYVAASLREALAH